MQNVKLVSVLALLVAIVCASSASADTLSDMSGAWRGSGWAKETPTGPKEAVRCKIANSYDAATLTLTLKGQCVVPGRRLTVAGKVIGQDDSPQITGRWSNPDGLGSTRISGIQKDGIVAFNFRALNPGTGKVYSQNVEWRVSASELRLRSSDRDSPEVVMSDISFGR